MSQTKNQDCAEQMIFSAAERINPAFAKSVQKTVQDAYNNQQIQDNPIDLYTFFGIKTPESNIIVYWGKNKDELKTGLQTLDTTHNYFLRTGTNGGGGHYQLLHFEHSCWHIYSSPSNKYTVTNEKGDITEEGKTLLAPYAIWGTARNAYSYSFTMVSTNTILGVIDYMINVRTHSYEYALEELFK